MNALVREIGVAESETPAAPQVFVRSLVAPPGLPWEQRRAAVLDARHGAPVPIAELMHQVRRLEPWALGRPGRYGAFYVRLREFRSAFEASVEVDGKPVTVRFGTPARDLGRLREVGLVVAALVLSGAVLGTGVMLALGARSEATAQLEAAERLAANRLRMAEAARKRADQARDLRVAVGTSRPVGDMLSDLTWLATSKSLEARIVGVHWEGGILAVEARGEQAPFQAVDRPVERSAKPIRPGVWLWGVAPPGGDGSRGAVAAEIRP